MRFILLELDPFINLFLYILNLAKDVIKNSCLQIKNRNIVSLVLENPKNIMSIYKYGIYLYIFLLIDIIINFYKKFTLSIIIILTSY